MTAVIETGPEALRGAFIEAMSRVAATVSVVATDGPCGRAGATVSSLVSVSADGARPTLSVCLHRDSATARAVRANRVFSVNVLAAGQRHVGETFSGQAGLSGGARFEMSDWQTGRSGAPQLAGSCLTFECRVARVVEIGTHHVVFGDVETVALGPPVPPLVYVARSYAAVGALPRRNHPTAA